MPRSCLQIICGSGVQSHVSPRIRVHVSCHCLKPAQERQKLFLQELEELLISPPPPAAIRLHTGHKRKGTASAQHAVPSTSEENSPISIPSQNLKKIAIQCCSSKHKRGKSTNTCTIGLSASWHPSLATTSQKRWDSANKSNRLFQFCS